MFPHTDTTLLLNLHHDHVAALWAEADADRLARTARPAAAHRSARWWSRLAQRTGTRAAVHP